MDKTTDKCTKDRNKTYESHDTLGVLNAKYLDKSQNSKGIDVFLTIAAIDVELTIKKLKIYHLVVYGQGQFFCF